MSTRLDKWLWAARFFKTRSMAKKAIEGGKVSYDGQRAKVSKDVEIGAELTIRQGWDEKTVTVVTLSEKRGNATMADQLYKETETSIAKRQLNAEQRRAAREAMQPPLQRPDKKERRQLTRFKQGGAIDGGRQE